MRKNIRKSVVVLLASLAMVPALTACENNDITTSKGRNNQTETVDNLGLKRKYSKSITSDLSPWLVRNYKPDKKP